MRLSDEIRTKLWNDGTWVATAIAVPKISMKLRGAMELVQNDINVTPEQVTHTLKGILNILVEDKQYLSEANTYKLIKLFNNIASAYCAQYTIEWGNGKISGTIGRTPCSFEELCDYLSRQD